jgi:hypothetical protein
MRHRWQYIGHGTTEPINDVIVMRPQVCEVNCQERSVTIKMIKIILIVIRRWTMELFGTNNPKKGAEDVMAGE